MSFFLLTEHDFHCASCRETTTVSIDKHATDPGLDVIRCTSCAQIYTRYEEEAAESESGIAELIVKRYHELGFEPLRWLNAPRIHIDGIEVRRTKCERCGLETLTKMEDGSHVE